MSKMKLTNQECPNCNDKLVFVPFKGNEDMKKLSCVECISNHYTDEVESMNDKETILTN